MPYKEIKPVLTPFEILYHYRIANNIPNDRLTDLQIIECLEIYLDDYKEELTRAN